MLLRASHGRFRCYRLVMSDKTHLLVEALRAAVEHAGNQHHDVGPAGLLRDALERYEEFLTPQGTTEFCDCGFLATGGLIDETDGGKRCAKCEAASEPTAPAHPLRPADCKACGTVNGCDCFVGPTLAEPAERIAYTDDATFGGTPIPPEGLPLGPQFPHMAPVTLKRRDPA